MHRGIASRRVKFIHDDPEFAPLLGIVAREVGVAAALVEKDYWVTHCLWALQRTGLDLWFKGGTSLSKGFGLIQRFSEDLDLMVRHGSVAGLPQVASWTSRNAGPVAQREAFYTALAGAFVIPGVRIEIDKSRRDEHAHGADYVGRYPGVLSEQLAPAMSPFVRLEVGRARVVPFVEMHLSSFLHDALARRGALVEFIDNRAAALRCVHPLVTLLEKIDAMARRYARDVMEPDSFIRHYEDAAHVVRAMGRLPAIELTPLALAEDMVRQKDILAVPRIDEPALLLSDVSRRAAIARAYERISPMFWGSRIPLDEACASVIAWVRELHR